MTRYYFRDGQVWDGMRSIFNIKDPYQAAQAVTALNSQTALTQAYMEKVHDLGIEKDTLATENEALRKQVANLEAKVETWQETERVTGNIGEEVAHQLASENADLTRRVQELEAELTHDAEVHETFQGHIRDALMHHAIKFYNPHKRNPDKPTIYHHLGDYITKLEALLSQYELSENGKPGECAYCGIRSYGQVKNLSGADCCQDCYLERTNGTKHFIPATDESTAPVQPLDSAGNGACHCVKCQTIDALAVEEEIYANLQARKNAVRQAEAEYWSILETVNERYVVMDTAVYDKETGSYQTDTGGWGSSLYAFRHRTPEQAQARANKLNAATDNGEDA